VLLLVMATGEPLPIEAAGTFAETTFTVALFAGEPPAL